MKVLGIVCSPRKNGNTEILIGEALAGATSCGAETELWTTARKELKPCDGCRSCVSHDGKCHIDDDMQELYPKVLAADGIIFGAPSYFESVSAQGKIVIDRLYALYNMELLTSKVAGVITLAGSSGHEGVYTPFRNFIDFCHMLPAEHTHGWGVNKGEVRQDEYGMKSAQELGKQVVLLIKQQFRWPEAYTKLLYRFCEANYGISAYPINQQANHHL